MEIVGDRPQEYLGSLHFGARKRSIRPTQAGYFSIALCECFVFLVGNGQ